MYNLSVKMVKNFKLFELASMDKFLLWEETEFFLLSRQSWFFSISNMLSKAGLM